MDNYLAKKYPGDWSRPTPIEIATDGFYGTSFLVIASFGGWLVTVDGDLIYRGVEKPYEWYPIYDNQLRENENDDWVLHLSEKEWFTTECYEDFKRAYFLACKIAGTEPEKQIRDYAERKRKSQKKEDLVVSLTKQLGEFCETWIQKHPKEDCEFYLITGLSNCLSAVLAASYSSRKEALACCDRILKIMKADLAQFPDRFFYKETDKQ